MFMMNVMKKCALVGFGNVHLENVQDLNPFFPLNSPWPLRGILDAAVRGRAFASPPVFADGPRCA